MMPFGNLSSKSRGVARLGVRLLESAKRSASAEGTDLITASHVQRMCQIEQIDALGLDAIEQQYLQILRDGEGPVRLNVIATQMGLPRQSIEMFESDFIRLGPDQQVGKRPDVDGKGHRASGRSHRMSVSE